MSMSLGCRIIIPATEWLSLLGAYLEGTPFRTDPVLRGESTQDGILTGSPFRTQAILHGGGTLTGTGFATNAELSATMEPSAWLTGTPFRTTPVLTGDTPHAATLTGTGFATEAALYGGGVLTGAGFRSALEAIVDSAAFGTLTGGTFTTTPLLSGYGNEVGILTGTGFVSELQTVVDIDGEIAVTGFPSLIGSPFQTLPILRGSVIVTPGAAFVMNTRTTEVTRYTDFDFRHIVRIGANYYGVKADGFYLLGDYPVTPCYIDTKETDFGVYQSKNLNAVYLNSDTSTMITEYADGVRVAKVPSAHKGRKTKLAKGATARYWKLRIENITRVEGMELLVHTKQRRVG